MNLTLVVGSGHCGIPVLSRILRDHPDVLSVVQPFTARPADPRRTVIPHLAAAAGRATVVGCSGASLPLVPALHAAFPRARFVHMFRDGPDCALAMSRDPARPAAPIPLPAVGTLWSSTILDGVAALERLPAPLTTTLRHEDLMGSPEATLTRLAAYLGVPVDGDWLARSRSLIDPSAIGAARALPAAELAALEAACAPGMKALGRIT